MSLLQTHCFRLLRNNLKRCNGLTLHTSACLCGRKSRKPYDRRNALEVFPKDIADQKAWGSRELRKEYGLRGDMPQPPGYVDRLGRFHFVQEMVPEFIVPDLKDFKLKPYVSYKVPDVTQKEFTAEDLFNASYAKNIIKDYQSGKLKENDLDPDLLLEEYKAKKS